MRMNKAVSKIGAWALTGMLMIGSVLVGVNGLSHLVKAGNDSVWKLKTAQSYTADASKYSDAYATLFDQLGVATEFGLFVEGTTTLNGHMDSNLATSVFNQGANFNAGAYTNNVKGLVYIADPNFRPSSQDIKADTLIVGTTNVELRNASEWYVNGIKVTAASNIGNVMYSNPDNQFINLQDEFTRLRALSATYAGKSTQDADIDSSTITFNGTNKIQYLTVNAVELANPDMTINTGSADLCVINVDLSQYTASTFTLTRNKVNGIGTNSTGNLEALSLANAKVLFNFYGNSNVTVQTDEAVGTFLLPNNNFFMSNTSSGRFICKNFTNGGEIHFVFTLKTPVVEEETTTVAETTTTAAETTTATPETTTAVETTTAAETTTATPETTTATPETTTATLETTTATPETTTATPETTTAVPETTTATPETTTATPETTTAVPETTTAVSETTTATPETTTAQIETESITETESATVMETQTVETTANETTKAGETEADTETTVNETTKPGEVEADSDPETTTVTSTKRGEVEADTDSGEQVDMDLFKALLGISGFFIAGLGAYALIKKHN